MRNQLYHFKNSGSLTCLSIGSSVNRDIDIDEILRHEIRPRLSLSKEKKNENKESEYASMERGTTNRQYGLI